MASVKDKVVIITGGSKGIGKATAKLFAQEGAKVVCISRKKLEVTKTAQELREEGFDALGIRADVKKLKHVQEAVSRVLNEFKRIDILINNAAIINWKNFLEQEEKDWNTEVDTNIKGVLNCTRAIAPHMVKQKDGIIINIASESGKTGSPKIAVYSATKFAVLGFTQGFAQEVKDQGIRVYAVCPGPTKTAMTGFTGMTPEKVAKRILKVAEEKLRLKPGGDTEIYS